MPESAGRPPGPVQAATALMLSVKLIRRRARAVLLGTAALAALAADVWYEIAANAIGMLLNVGIYFPLFALVAFAVLAARVFHRTRLTPFSRDLDARFGLKERLGAAASYRVSRTIPAVIVEAQAHEAAASIDLAALRRSFRFKPYGALLALCLGTAVMAWLVWRYPEHFQPRNLVFQGGTLMLADHGHGGGGRSGDGAGGKATTRRPGPAERPAAPAKQTPPLAGDAGKGADKTGEADSGKKSDQAETAAKKPEAPPEKDSRGKPGPTQGKGAGNSPKQSNGLASASRETRWTREQSRAYEETPRVSAATTKPEGGPAVTFPDLRARDPGQPLPPLPFFRLLSGKQPTDALIDPGTVTIILETYPAKYRSHLESFLKALQSRREYKRGS